MNGHGCCIVKLSEWESYIATDDELRLDGFAEAEAPDGTLRIESDGLSVRTSYSKHLEGGNMAWFYYSDGKVQVENPDQEISQKMYSIAQVLDTKVQAEECETYNRIGEPEVPSFPESKDKWWKFWK